MTIDSYRPTQDYYVNPSFDDRYMHTKTAGPTYDPGIVHACRVAHAEGYLAAGLAKAEGVVDGYLVPQIDKSSSLLEDGDVTLYLAYANQQGAGVETPVEAATARLLNFRTPTVELFSPAQQEEIDYALMNLASEGYDVHELGALSKTRGCKTVAVAEIIRQLLRDTAGKNIALYCSMVKPVRQLLVQSLSEGNLLPISSPVLLPETEYRNQTELVPVVIYPDELLPRMLESIELEQDPKTKVHRIQSILFYCHGLGLQFVPRQVLDGELQSYLLGAQS